MRAVYLGVIVAIGHACVSTAFLVPSVSSKSMARLQTRVPALRLYARVTPRQGEQKQGTEDEQGLPRLLGDAEQSMPPFPEDKAQITSIEELGMGTAAELDGENWEAAMERKLQDMYARGTYDPTPVTQTPDELAKQQWMEEFLNKEESPVQWNFNYWFGTWFRSDVHYASAGRGIKSFSFAVVVIGLTALLFLVEDEVIQPVFDDYNNWDGNDYIHVWGDLGGWALGIPSRVQDYIAHFDLQEYLAKVSARAGAAPRWQNQLLGLPGGLTGENPGGP